MPKYAKNPNELNKLLEKELERVIQQEITTLIEMKVNTSIQEGVYDLYDPKVYQRTWTLQGSATHDLMKNGSIVYMDAYSDNIYDVIEEGKAFMPFERPFFSKLVEEINSGELTDEVTMLLDKSFK